MLAWDADVENKFWFYRTDVDSAYRRICNVPTESSVFPLIPSAFPSLSLWHFNASWKVLYIPLEQEEPTAQLCEG